MEFSPMHVTESGISAMGVVLRVFMYGGVPLAILGMVWAARAARGSLLPSRVPAGAVVVGAFAVQIASALLSLLAVATMVTFLDDPFLDRYLLVGASSCVVLSAFAVPAWRSLWRLGHRTPGERVTP